MSSLDPEDWTQLKCLGNEVLSDIISYLEHIRDSKVWTPMTDEVRSCFFQASPKCGIDASFICDEIRRCVLQYGSGNLHPGFMGWVQGGGAPVAILGDIIASGRDHVGIALEQQVVRWVAEWFHFDPDIAKGLFVTGSSMANFIGLLVAKKAAEESLSRHLNTAQPGQAHPLLQQMTPAPVTAPKESPRLVRGFTVYTSAAAHKCIAQAVDMAGLDTLLQFAQALGSYAVPAHNEAGSDIPGTSSLDSDGDSWGDDALLFSRSLRRIPVNGDCRMRLDLLQAAISRDRSLGFLPLMIVATAGTVDVGAVDDLQGIATIAAREDIWMHIDGAYGALGVLSASVGPLLAGIEQADSVAFDFHKWGQVQYDSGMIIVREGGRLKDTFSCATAYLSRADRGMLAGDFWPTDYGPDLSRGCRALKTWVTIKAHGTSGMGRVIDHSCALAQHLSLRIAEKAEWVQLMAPVAMNIVCFRFHPRTGTSEEWEDRDYSGGRGWSVSELNSINREIVFQLHEEGRVAPSLTTLDGQEVIRAGLFNHRTTISDVDCLVESVIALGCTLTRTSVAPAATSPIDI